MRQGWVKVGFHRGIWIPCPPAFPAGMDTESWAAGYARTWWESSGKKHGKREVRLLAQNLAAIHANTYGVLPCHLALIHLPDPGQPPLLVCFGIWPALGERDSQLRMLAHADEAAAMQHGESRPRPEGSLLPAGGRRVDRHWLPQLRLAVGGARDRRAAVHVVPGPRSAAGRDARHR